ncbi:ACP S-malonyltransferase [Raoultibacter phocaeensis]|uniref:ACP S-malonyltransferase n=1 Tax=Raoultibacter phocaeensis TaxID=2479841 RepID=UPI002108358B|nr:ACP S-malonyltransferase [Raoultibacter phocaeensis]
MNGNGPVFMLSGQGSQAPGMGADLLEVPEVAEAFSCASEAFGFDVRALAAEGSAEELGRTLCAQAVICALSTGIACALVARGVMPGAVLGFSLGQIGALAVSGMLGLEETFALAAHRAKLMERAAAEHPGVMCALIGADEESVRDVCEASAKGDVLVAANYNCPGQIVVSGTPGAIARAQEAWASRNKRSALLATEGGFHSPLLAEASDELVAYLSSVTFAEARIPLVCNVDARPLAAKDAADHLARHLTHPVRFEESVRSLARAGASDFVETGFGGVLVGLVKRIDKTLVRTRVEDRAGFEAACERYCANTENEKEQR